MKNKFPNKAITQSYKRLLEELWNGNSESFSPHEFKQCISQYAHQFSGHSQMDFQEFLSSFLNCIHNDLNTECLDNKV